MSFISYITLCYALYRRVAFNVFHTIVDSNADETRFRIGALSTRRW